MGSLRITITVLKILEYLLQAQDEEAYALKIARATGLSNGALFPALDRLTKAGHLTSVLEDIDEHVVGRRKRRYFKLTESGAQLARTELQRAPALPSAILI